MNKHYKAIIQYNGAKYSGWQKQPEQPTVQEEIEKSLSQLFDHDKIKVVACSRTDSKVHALGQALKISVPRKWDVEELKDHLNKTTPEDILIRDLGRINPGFKVSYHAKHKEYLYFFTTAETTPYSWVTPFPLAQIDLIKNAAKIFEGNHDFSNFQIRGDFKGSAKRRVMSCEILPMSEIVNGDTPEDHHVMRIKGQGFLKNMVRLIIGSLSKLGQDHWNEDYLRYLLTPKEEGDLPVKKELAPGSSLFLHYIHYVPKEGRAPLLDLSKREKIELSELNFPSEL
jgi:tRNA pseudouridine38-40 synthase